MKNILTIIKKELIRVFKDKRLVFTTILMPGLMIFLLYSINLWYTCTDQKATEEFF